MTTTTRKPRTPDRLKGKTVTFFRLAKTRSGSRTGRVRSVTWTKRSGLKSVTVELTGGVKLKVSAYELCLPNHPTGIVWRGKLVPLAEWLDDGFLADVNRQIAIAARRRGKGTS